MMTIFSSEQGGGGKHAVNLAIISEQKILYKERWEKQEIIKKRGVADYLPFIVRQQLVPKTRMNINIR